MKTFTKMFSCEDSRVQQYAPPLVNLGVKKLRGTEEIKVLSEESFTIVTTHTAVNAGYPGENMKLGSGAQNITSQSGWVAPYS